MSKEMIDALNQLADKFGIAVDWSSQNALPYLRELMSRVVHFELITSVIWMIWGTLHFVSIPLWLKWFRYAQKKYEEDTFSAWDFGKVLIIIGMATTIIFGFFIVACQVEDILKCIMLPESIVLKYIKGASS